MSELELARCVFENLDSNVDTTSELQLLQDSIEEKGELNCEGFVTNVKSVAWTWFNDSEMLDQIDDPEIKINDVARIQYMREKLESKIEGFLEEDSSLSIHKIEIDKNRQLFLWALVTIVTGGPSAELMTPVKSLAAVYGKIREMGYVADIEDINAIPSSELLSLWA